MGNEYEWVQNRANFCPGTSGTIENQSRQWKVNWQGPRPPKQNLPKFDWGILDYAASHIPRTNPLSRRFTEHCGERCASRLARYDHASCCRSHWRSVETSMVASLSFAHIPHTHMLPVQDTSEKGSSIALWKKEWHPSCAHHQKSQAPESLHGHVREMQNSCDCTQRICIVNHGFHNQAGNVYI